MIIINGRFLSQGITGVQRFAHEIIRELDKIVSPGEYKILAPQNIMYKELKYQNIEIEICGNMKGHLWEQIELPYYVKKNKGKLINLCNTAPILKPGIVAIHDIQTKVYPEFFSKKFQLWYNILNGFNIKNAEKIITVSEFSKSEIVKHYKVSDKKIEVIYNGWQHMDRIEKDETILEKLDVKKDEYILGVSSMNPNKNFKYILGLAKLHPEYKFVIVGKKNSEVFKDGTIEELDNLTWAGYVSDEELKGLYSNAKAFIFPSFYEGFGIPPLEAIASGCKNIFVSNTSCLPEIYRDYVNYFNPQTIEKQNENKKNSKKILDIYSWKISAKKLQQIEVKI
ncbi:MAG: glycosyltransferase family 4 protein [Cetobacterium sp.]